MPGLDEMAKEPAKERKQARVEAEIEQIEAALKNGYTYADITASVFGEAVKPGTFATMLWRARRKRQKRETAKQAAPQPKTAKKPTAAPQKRERKQPAEPESEPEQGETPAQIRQRLIENERDWDFHAAPERQQRLCRYRNQQAAQTEYLEPSVDDLPPPWSKQAFEPGAIDETWHERWAEKLTTDAKNTVNELRKAEDWRDVHFALKSLQSKKRASVGSMNMVQHPNIRTMFEESKPLAKQR